jgi:hypothetical protein
MLLAAACAAGGATVTLALDPGSPQCLVSMPPTVTIDAGKTSATFPIVIIGQGFDENVTLVASYASSVVRGTLHVLPTPPPVIGGRHACAVKLAKAGNDLTYVHDPDLPHGFIQMTSHSRRCLEGTIRCLKAFAASP